MTEDEARSWLDDREVPRETLRRLSRYVDLLIAESAQQNLIASSTIPQIWSRHIVDSAQLLTHAPATGRWLDLGSGAGLPGLVVAILGDHHVTLVETRAKRAAFLNDMVTALGLEARATVIQSRVEQLPAQAFDIISARAFAPLDRLLGASSHLADQNTTWVLPKGRAVQAELDVAAGSWQGDFRTVPSLTDPDARIVIACNVHPRARAHSKRDRR